jgi:hypothetical protein
MDQIAARVGQQTQLGSLELAIESGETAAAATTGSRASTATPFRGAARTPPLPMQNDPRVVFERLFGDSGSTIRRRV